MFESFVQILLRHTPQTAVSDLFAVYDAKTPSLQHRFVAALIRARLLDTVFTTNFDALLEVALHDEKLHPDADYALWCDDGDLVRRARLLPLLAKLHGSVRKPETLRSTIETIAEPRRKERRVAAIGELLRADHEDDALLVLGYSFSDELDVNEAIRRYPGRPRRILIVHHVKDAPIIRASLDAYPARRVFEGWKGSVEVFLGDTARFVREVWAHPGIAELLGKPQEEEVSHDWQQHLDAWASALGPSDPILLDLCQKTDSPDLEDYARALIVASSRLEEPKQQPQLWLLGMLGLVVAKRRGQEPAQAIVILNELESHLNGSENLALAYDFALQAAAAHAELNEIDEAEAQLKRARRLGESLGHEQAEVVYLGNMAALMDAAQRPRRAVRFLEKLLPKLAKMGEPERTAMTLFKLGQAKFKAQEHSSAVEHLEMALDYFERLRSVEHQRRALSLLAQAHAACGHLEDARRCASKALA